MITTNKIAMELEATKEEIRERFRLTGEIWMMCCELAEGDCRADLDDFSLEAYEMEDYLPGVDVEPEIDMGCIFGRHWFNGVSFDDNPTLMIDYVEEWFDESKQSRKIHCSLPAIYTPSKTLEVVCELIEQYVKSLKDYK